MPILKAEVIYTLEVTEDEIHEIVKGLSLLTGQPNHPRDSVAYRVLGQLNEMVGLIQRCNEAVEKANSPEPEPDPSPTSPPMPPKPPVIAPPGGSESDGEGQGTSGDPPAIGPPKPPPDGVLAPPAPSHPVSLPPGIFPPGPPAPPPNKDSKKKSKKKKAKS